MFYVDFELEVTGNWEIEPEVAWKVSNEVLFSKKNKNFEILNNDNQVLNLIPLQLNVIK